jgi:hypothetical protein
VAAAGGLTHPIIDQADSPGSDEVQFSESVMTRVVAVWLVGLLPSSVVESTGMELC